jgi:RHS repeat-associated protein
VHNLYQGMTLDPVTGLYYARNRNYSPSLGRWINQDPAGYINGANTYQFVMSNPVGNVDPEGLMSGSQFIQWLNDTYHEAVPGGEFVDATGLVPDGVKAWLYTQAENRLIKDQGMCPPKNPFTDPIYNALYEYGTRPADYCR